MACVGVPADFGNVVAPGARFAPQRIRSASRALPEPAVRGVDHGDIACCPNDSLRDIIARTALAVGEILDLNARPILIGGDHSISLAAIQACQEREEITVVWVDAHTDFSRLEPETAPNHKQVLRRVSQLPGVHQIVQIGHRSFTPFDERHLSEKLTVLPARRVRDDPRCVLATVAPARRCYVSIDIDVVDPNWAPGTSTPVPGGLSPEQLVEVLQSLGGARRVAAIDLMEVNPVRDRADNTCQIAAEILRRTLCAALR